jgi:hypothetical protein
MVVRENYGSEVGQDVTRGVNANPTALHAKKSLNLLN